MNLKIFFLLSTLIVSPQFIFSDTHEIIKSSEPEELEKPIEFSIGPSVQLKGQLLAKDAITMHSYVLYFNGQQTRSNDNGFFTFLPSSEKKITSLGILICRNFIPQFGKLNSIQELISHPDRYRYFVCTKNQNYQEDKNKKIKEGEGFWNITEEKLCDSSHIPENCITLLADPKFLKGIENWRIHLEEKFIPLPRIFLKNKQELVADKPSRAQKQGYIKEAADFWSNNNAAESSAFCEALNNKEEEHKNGKTSIDISFITRD